MHAQGPMSVISQGELYQMYTEAVSTEDKETARVDRLRRHLEELTEMIALNEPDDIEAEGEGSEH